MSKNFVRGGQLNIHNLRMIKQVTIFSVMISASVAAFILVWQLFQSVPVHALRQYVSSYHAEIMLPFKHKSTQHQFTVSWPENGYNRQVRAIDILNHSYTYQLRNDIHSVLRSNAWDAILAGFLALLIIVVFWGFKGRRSHQHKSLRGQNLVSDAKLKSLIYLKKRASHFKISSLPLIKDSETKHILAIGTTGAGKTNLFNELIPQIRNKHQKAVVIDTTGDMISKYYDPERGDIILNPFDSRSSSWDIINECEFEYEFDDLSKSIIPPSSSYQDPLWKNGSAKLLSVGLQKAKEQKLSPQSLFRIFSEVPLTEFGAFFKGTEAYPFADPKGEKTTLSFRSTLSSYTQFLKLMKPSLSSDLSLKKWISRSEYESKEHRGGWIFVTANENMIQTLNPFMSAIFNTLSTSLMSLEEDIDRRVWFILDELPALQKLQSLSALLSKGRKYGACIFGGLQSMSQFDELYGNQGAKTILNLFNTKFFFRFEESNACEQISKWIGEEEIEESKEGLSYGAHQMRDGVSLNMNIRQRRIVLPTEISQLKDLECIVKLPGSFPIARLKMKFNKIKRLNDAFQQKKTQINR